MHKNALQHIDHVAIWPVISFVIFFLFFLVLLWWVFSADKSFIKNMAHMPMEDGTVEKENISVNHTRDA